MKNILYTFLSLLLLVQSCSKDQQPPEQNPTVPFHLLDSIIWKENNVKAFFTYNQDSTQQRIIYWSNLAVDTISFNWQNKRVKEIKSSRSPRKTVYQYNNYDQVHSIEMSSLYSTSSTLLEFSYNGDGKPSSLKYFLKNEAGSNLVYTTSYEYNDAGIYKMISIAANGSSVITTIDAWSEMCNFNPWAYISSVALAESYELYNLPVLATMHKLPAKLTRTVNNVTEKIQTTTFGITDGKLDYSRAIVAFPAHPEYDTETEALFFY